jgi:hypothetical protein
MNIVNAPEPQARFYSDRSMIVRVVERTLPDGHVEVVSDGPTALRGRHLFATPGQAAEFLKFLARQLQCAGFAEIWFAARDPGYASDVSAPVSCRQRSA